MRSEHPHTGRIKVIGVIFHERRTAFEPFAHDFHNARHRRSLPVALGTETVAGGHQPLHSQTGQLFESVQIFEGGGERFESALFKKRAHPDFDTGLFANIFHVRTGADRVTLFVFRHEVFDLLVGNFLNVSQQIAHAVAVDRITELDLRLHLVAFSDRHLTHIVAEAGNFKVL